MPDPDRVRALILSSEEWRSIKAWLSDRVDGFARQLQSCDEPMAMYRLQGMIKAMESLLDNRQLADELCLYISEARSHYNKMSI